MKKKLFILVGLLTVLIPVNVSAATGNITLSCDKTILKPKETTVCSVKGTSPDQVASAHAGVKVGENLTVSEMKQDSIWLGDGSNGAFDAYTDSNKTGNFNIGTFVITASDVKNGADSSVTLYDLAFGDGAPDFAETYFEDVTLKIRIASTINTLNSLTVDNTLIEGFAADKTEYSFTVDSSKASVTIGATKTNESSKLTGDIGVKPLKYGMNIFKVVVTSESGTAKNYVIKINRPEIRELKTLTINETPVALDEGVYEYNINVENAITSLDIAAELANKEDVEFVKDFGPRTVKDLKVGTNEVLIKVDDKKGDVLTYKLVITRAEGKKGNVKNPSTGDNNYFFLILAVGTLGGVSYLKLRKLKNANK